MHCLAAALFPTPLRYPMGLLAVAGLPGVALCPIGRLSW